MGRGLPRRDLAQRAPDALLERRSSHVERQIDRGGLRCFDPADDARDPLLESGLAADQLRSGKAVLDLATQLRRIVAERDRADTALAGGDQNRTERTLAN